MGTPVKIAFVFNRKTNDSLEQAEFDSDETVEAIVGALRCGGHHVDLVEMPLDDSRPALIEALLRKKPEIVFNTAEGYTGVARESFGPSVFEELGLPFVGTGSQGCLLTLDKEQTKRVATGVGVRIVPGVLVREPSDIDNAEKLVFPLFVKPNYEGSSKGITLRSVVKTPAELKAVGTESLARYPEGILVEEFVPGRDVGVPYIAGLGDDGVLEPVEYVLKNVRSEEERIYDYDRKNVDENSLECVCPALVSAEQRMGMISAMKRLVPALGVHDFARADFRVSPSGDVYFLEVNALPSLQRGAGIFDSAARLGLSYEAAILKILEAGMKRYGFT
ncbi:MAG: hypothetical protein IPK82_05825 [Polyangiaceae bacterium]|nr:hypothetical protein [Polyangiaceae bacterium]